MPALHPPGSHNLVVRSLLDTRMVPVKQALPAVGRSSPASARSARRAARRCTGRQGTQSQTPRTRAKPTGDAGAPVRAGRGMAPGAPRSPPPAFPRRPAPLQRPGDRPRLRSSKFRLDAAGLQQLYEEKVGCSNLLALLGDGSARLPGAQRYMLALRVVLCLPVEPQFRCRLATQGVLCSTFAAAADNNCVQLQLVHRPVSY